MAEHRSNLGLVSPDVPLISNLSIVGNIALIRQYHENLPPKEAEGQALGCLHRFGIGSTAGLRNPALGAEERFFIMLIRAAMVRDAVVVLDRPFRLFPEPPAPGFFDEALRKIDEPIAEVHVFDYHWAQERYRTNHDAAR